MTPANGLIHETQKGRVKQRAFLFLFRFTARGGGGWKSPFWRKVEDYFEIVNNPAFKGFFSFLKENQT